MALTSLAGLVGDQVDEFLAAKWQRALAFLPGGSSRFSRLFSWREVDRILQEGRLPSRYVRQPSGERTESVEGDSELARGVGPRRLLQDGFTLVVNDVRAETAGLEELASGLERDLYERVQVNAYAGAGTMRGFEPHWDGHEVFALQVAGAKRWRVFRPTESWPIGGRSIHECVALTEAQLGNPELERVLRPGEALYIPRGWWHVADPTGEPTLHLSVSLKSRTGIDYVQWLSRALESEELLREPLLRGLERETQQARIVRRLAELVRPESIEMFLAQDASRTTRKPSLGLPWSIGGKPKKLENEEILRWIPTRTSIEEADHTTIRSGGRTWKFSEHAASVLRALIDSDVVHMSSLVGQSRDERWPNLVTRLVTNLLREGLIEIVSPPSREKA